MRYKKNHQQFARLLKKFVFTPSLCMTGFTAILQRVLLLCQLMSIQILGNNQY